jgi:hypothetical protein
MHTEDLPRELQDIEAIAGSLISAVGIATPYIREHKTDPAVREFVDRIAQRLSDLADSLDEAAGNGAPQR